MIQIRSNDRAVRRRVTGLAAMLVVATVISACGGGDNSTLPVAAPGTDAPGTDAPAATEVAPPVAEAPPDPAAEAAWLELTDRISDEGEVDLQTAIDAFSMTIAPLPGATPMASGGPQLDSATGPVQWLARHLDELTPEQRAIVTTALTPAGMESAPTAPGGSLANSFVRSAVPEPPEDEPYTGCFGETPIFRDSTEMGEFRSILDGAYLALAEYLGHLDSIPYIALTDDEVAPNVKAISMPFNIDCSKPAQTCTILLTKKGAGLVGKALFSILVHELVHCYQGTVASIDQMRAMEPWRMEGFANWAAETVVEGSDRPEADMHWRGYLDHPEKGLFGRSYDAIGFFAHMDETGTDPWALFTPMVKAASNEAAWSLGIGTGDTAERFLMSWPTGFTRQPERGMAWDFTGPGIPADFAVVPAAELPNDGHVTVAAARVADGLKDVQVHSDFVTFAASANAKGKIGFDDNTERTFSEVAGVTFCMKADGCICPAGKVLPDDIVLATFPGESALVAVTGGLEAASVEIDGPSLETLCIDAIDPCLVGTWQSGTFAIPATILGQGLAFVGGAGATLTIDIAGKASYNFDGMAQLVMTDHQTGTDISQSSAGPGSSTIAAKDGVFTVTDGNFGGVTHRMAAGAFGEPIYDSPSKFGPATFVAQISGTYSCGDGSFTFTSYTDVEGTPLNVSVPFVQV